MDYENYTFEDWVASIEKVKQETGEYGMIDVVDNHVLLQYYLRTQGKNYLQYNDEGKPELAFSKENFTTFMDAIGKLAKEEAIPTAEVASNIKSFDENPFSRKVAYYQKLEQSVCDVHSIRAADGVELSLNLPYGARWCFVHRPSFFYSVAQTSKIKKQQRNLSCRLLVNDEEANKIIGTERGFRQVPLPKMRFMKT